MPIDICEQLAFVAYELHHEIQTTLMIACLTALAVILSACLFRVLAPIVDVVWRRFLRLDGFGRMVTMLAIVAATFYGGAKHDWSRVLNGGADDNLCVIGIYTAVSNEVTTVGGVAVTNQLNYVVVCTTNTPLPATTDVSVRMADTNVWNTIAKQTSWTETYGTTNAFCFFTQGDYSTYRYWWVGNDRPAVVITSSEITVTSFVASSSGVNISWTCANPLATTFDVQYKDATNSVWTTAKTVNTNQATVSGFFLNRTIDWRIISEYLEDGE